jgi:hypothetical protein
MQVVGGVRQSCAIDDRVYSSGGSRRIAKLSEVSREDLSAGIFSEGAFQLFP